MSHRLSKSNKGGEGTQRLLVENLELETISPQPQFAIGNEVLRDPYQEVVWPDCAAATHRIGAQILPSAVVPQGTIKAR